MKIRKLSKFCIILGITLCAKATLGYPASLQEKNPTLALPQHQANQKTPADSAWEALTKIEEYENAKIPRSLVHKRARIKFWNEGNIFWQRFPDDKRRYIWLQDINSSPPIFWLNDVQADKDRSDYQFYTAPLDKALTDDWHKKMAYYETIFLNDPTVSKENKYTYACSRLLSELTLSANTEYRGNKNEFMKSVASLFKKVESYLDPESEIGMLRRSIEALFLGSANYGVSLDDLRKFVNMSLHSNNRKVNRWAQQKLALLQLEFEPMEEAFPLPDGNYFDIKRLRGKVVLIDIWNINCSTCIARMPDLKKMYDKYKNDGFEVLSISTDPLDKYWRLDSIVRGKIGATWPMILTGGKSLEESRSPQAFWRNLWEQYGFFSVPQMLLLNREGQLIAINGPLQKGNFSNLIETSLKQ